MDYGKSAKTTRGVFSLWVNKAGGDCQLRSGSLPDNPCCDCPSFTAALFPGSNGCG